MLLGVPRCNVSSLSDAPLPLRTLWYMCVWMLQHL